MTHPQVFLGGACGHTTWRTDTAIPILEQAGISFFNPQLPDGAWTPAHQYLEMEVKNVADVWLFVINDQTRGIASIGEVAYRIAQEGKLALMLTDISEATILDNRHLGGKEIDDINRGRVYLRAMAEAHGIPVFDTVEDAANHAVILARQAQNELSETKLRAIAERVQIPGYTFLCGRLAGKLTVQIQKAELNYLNSEVETMTGRVWLLEPDATEGEVVRTMLKAALTWEEHELRERFRFDGAQIFTPHFQLPYERPAHP